MDCHTLYKAASDEFFAAHKLFSYNDIKTETCNTATFNMTEPDLINMYRS